MVFYELEEMDASQFNLMKFDGSNLEKVKTRLFFTFFLKKIE